MRLRQMVWGLLALTAAGPASALDWRELWETPAQRAERQLAQGEYRQLAEDAPDALWEGLARFEAGELDAAAKAFDQALTDAPLPDKQAVAAIRYNQATIATRQGRYADAVAGYDAALAADPTHAAATHNRAIAERLLALQEAESEAEQSEGGEAGDAPGDESGSGGGAEGEGSGEAPSQGEAGDAGAEDEQRQAGGDESAGDAAAREDAGSDAAMADDEEGEGTPGSQGAGRAAADDSEAGTDAAAATDSQIPLSEAQRAEEAAQAAAALAAEAGEPAGDEDPAAGDDAGNTALPLSEREQATEQWLRRIPDDPAGLLRRKLEQSHLNDYPEVRGSADRW